MVRGGTNCGVDGGAADGNTVGVGVDGGADGSGRLEVLRLLVLEWPAVDWTAMEWTVVEWMTVEWAVMEWTAEDLSGRGRRRNWTMTNCRHPTGEFLASWREQKPCCSL